MGASPLEATGVPPPHRFEAKRHGARKRTARGTRRAHGAKSISKGCVAKPIRGQVRGQNLVPGDEVLASDLAPFLGPLQYLWNS